eukprot:gnl/MRDRNA2_/MRDRNA2_67920_c0_seq2.p1 gnl/MRDRNA2_/MRDRNA2_67920_c0~~gnl/MRDRNA2_/MRDRNA2_67920_c0_seq2.p1  ORF type:complete len:277 (+),score=49.78 gnl/MRDRNA2_/MRDRNA2_67920_c0_seq2:160-990(+)
MSGSLYFLVFAITHCEKWRIAQAWRERSAPDKQAPELAGNTVIQEKVNSSKPNEASDTTSNSFQEGHEASVQVSVHSADVISHSPDDLTTGRQEQSLKQQSQDEACLVHEEVQSRKSASEVVVAGVIPSIVAMQNLSQQTEIHAELSDDKAVQDLERRHVEPSMHNALIEMASTLPPYEIAGPATTGWTAISPFAQSCTRDGAMATMRLSEPTCTIKCVKPFLDSLKLRYDLFSKQSEDPRVATPQMVDTAVKKAAPNFELNAKEKLMLHVPLNWH